MKRVFIIIGIITGLYCLAPFLWTVITAFSRDNLREGVFTSIDSAVIL